jgi:hypothetical protein
VRKYYKKGDPIVQLYKDNVLDEDTLPTGRLAYIVQFYKDNTMTAETVFIKKEKEKKKK